MDQPRRHCTAVWPSAVSIGGVRARVARDSHPAGIVPAPIVGIEGQVLDPRQFLSIPDEDGPGGLGITNAFVTYTDNTFNHYGRDLNVFLTLDKAY